MPLRLSISNSEKRGKRIIVAMLIAVGACAAIDLSFRWLLPPSDVVIRNRTAREYLRAEPVPEVQIFGDSVILRALIGDALSDGGALSVRNDALASSRPSTTYYLVRDELAAGRRPRAIVFAHMPRAFDDAYTARLAGTFAEWRELPDVYVAASRPTEALFGTLARFSYLLMNRGQLRDLLLHGRYEFFVTPEETNVYAAAEADLIVDRFLKDPMGYEASVDTFHGSISSEDVAPFSVSGEIDGYFRRTLALAKQHGVPVFWLTPPVSESVERVQEQSGFYDDLAAYLAPFEKSEDLVVLQLRPEAYPDDFFTDEVHPKASVTILFSCAMRRYGTVIANVVGGQPWRVRGDSDVAKFVGTPMRGAHTQIPRDWTGLCRDSGPASISAVAESPGEVDVNL